MTAISQIQSELAFNLAESGNIFSEGRSMYYIPRGTAKANEAAVRLGPFNIACEPSETMRQNDPSGSAHQFIQIADIQRADVANVTMEARLIDADTAESFSITEIIERDIVSTAVRIVKTTPVTAGRDFK